MLEVAGPQVAGRRRVSGDNVFFSRSKVPTDELLWRKSGISLLVNDNRGKQTQSYLNYHDISYVIAPYLDHT